MTDRLAGIDLPNGQDYGPYRAALSENFVNIADGLGSAYAMFDAGTIPFIHVMYHPDRQPGCSIQRIADGDYDHLIEDWFLELLTYTATGRKAVVVYLPEMNSNWVPAYATDDYSTVAFKKAWDQFVAKGKSMGLSSDKVLWCWAPNDTGIGDLSDWYPGTTPDIIGASAYNWGGLFDGEPWEWPAELFDRYVTEVRGFSDKPIVITQTGAGYRDHQQREWVDRMVQYVNDYQNIEGAIYYNELWFRLGEDCDWNEQAAILNGQRPDHWFGDEGFVPRHIAMLWLPDALRAAGVNVVELDGWKEAQGNYQWTNIRTGIRMYGEEPTCYMIHHTAGTSAFPEVKNSNGVWSKANCWAGLLRDGRLYQSGGGIPTIVFTSSGPARISSGYGNGPTLYEVADDVRVPWDQLNSDTGMAANRYAWNVETVAAGDGSAVDPGVERALVVMGALLAERFGWSPWRTIGHLTWTKRKLDPYWDGRRDVIVHIQEAVADYMGQGPAVPPPIEPPPGDDMDYRTVKNVPDANWARKVVDRMLCESVIFEGDGSDWEKPLKNGTIWNYLYRFTDAIQQDRISGC